MRTRQPISRSVTSSSRWNRSGFGNSSGMSRTDLEGAVLRMAERLPRGSIDAAAAGAEKASANEPDPILRTIAHPTYQRSSADLVAAWKTCPEVPGTALASMLRVAAIARAGALDQEHVDVVWTGPASHEVPSRSTEAVVLEIIEAATEQLLLVTYAAFPHEPLLAALRTAVNKGVHTQVLVETRAGAGALLTAEPAHVFDRIIGVRLLEWPVARRPVMPGAVRARMHAKVAVADRRMAFVTSANLTGSGITQNLECGLLVRGGRVPGRLADHVATLVTAGVFQPLAHPL
jgi:phosphatidylserine/phosphatidylglycerophosphate/cardiolipin synthase-like enzyme